MGVAGGCWGKGEGRDWGAEWATGLPPPRCRAKRKIPGTRSVGRAVHLRDLAPSSLPASRRLRLARKLGTRFSAPRRFGGSPDYPPLTATQSPIAPSPPPPPSTTTDRCSLLRNIHL